ncbi:hypothetical protein SNE40_003365 [Patella caerulea]|uniref:Endonuclease/exonuclease/phosphatase domain-containing protein n=1 Tax=Patella caerulea TaxID=87958 RepID=A0AAN8Q063_PATCE
MHCRLYCLKTCPSPLKNILNPYANSEVLYHYAKLTLMLSGDIHPNPGTTKLLTILHLNVRSLQSKLDMISAEMSEFDVLTFSETWLTDTSNTELLELRGYHKPILCNRTVGPGGGVAIYIRDSLYFKARLDLNIAGLEAVWVEIRNKNNIYLIGSFYRSPTANSEYWNLIEQSIELAKEQNIKTIILGDFNVNIINTNSSRISNIMRRFDLTQLIKSPTRITETTATLLDIILVSCPDNIHSTEILDANVSDHCPITITVFFKKPTCKTYPRQIWNYHDFDPIHLNNFLKSFDWDDFFDQSSSPNVLVENFSNILMKAVEKFVRHKFVTIRARDTPWMNGYIRNIIRKRNRIHKKAKYSNSPAHWQCFRKNGNFVISEIRKAKLNYYLKLDSDISSNRFQEKHWWNLVKQFGIKNGNSRRDLYLILIIKLYMEIKTRQIF